MNTNESLHKIIHLSMQIDIMLFEQNYNTKKWMMKDIDIINNLINNTSEKIYNSFCSDVKTLLNNYNYDKIIVRTGKLNKKMKIVQEIKSLIEIYSIMNKKLSNNDADIIESFSNQYV